MFFRRYGRGRFGLGGALCAAVAMVFVAAVFSAAAVAAPPEVRANDAHGLVVPRGYAGRPHGGGGSVLLGWHNGDVMTSAVVTPIYWGPSWDQGSFVGDKRSGLGAFYSGVGGSSYIGTNTEYTGVSGEQVTRNVSLNGDVVDTSATPRRAPSTSDILLVVQRDIANPVANGYYPVYTDIPRGHNGYCAWHSNGTVKGVPVQFAFFFNLDGDPGCDPKDTSGLHSQGLAALANVSGHELSEALTDPSGGGWYDQQGQENADKCAWTFNGLETFSDSTRWLVQGNFSNNAYNAKNGYDGAGCINGN